MRHLFLILTLMLAGCVSYGTEVKQSDLSGFEKGKTTRAEVEAKLGQPNSVSTNADGTISTAYVYAYSKARPETFIPLIGPLVGGADATTTTTAFRFNVNGVLTDYTTMQTKANGRMGAAAQAPTTQ